MSYYRQIWGRAFDVNARQWPKAIDEEPPE
jgi:hypothetical protein